MHYIQYMWTALERLSRGIYNKPRGPLSSEIIRWFSGQSDGKLDLTKGSQRYSKLSQLKGGHQARIHSDQMVLVMARCQSFLLSFHLLDLLIRLFALSTYLSICSIYLFVYLLYLLIFLFALSSYFLVRSICLILIFSIPSFYAFCQHILLITQYIYLSICSV